jgi:hypothetical protein
MPTFRIYYAEVESKDAGQTYSLGHPGYAAPRDYTTSTEWEDEITADDPVGALDLFFREHAPDRGRIAWVDEDGEAHAFEGWDFDPDATYIWTESQEDSRDGVRLLEYQGIDEATPGMVTCPLCNGHGEVTEELAGEFEDVWGEDQEPPV